VTTARRLSLDAAGRRKPVSGSEEILGLLPDGTPLPAEEIAQLEERHFVRQAFDQLPARCRALLDLLYYAAEAPSYERVSERLGMPVGSIGPTRARCLEKLARLFAEIEPQEPQEGSP
jgi:RNA polymerase sigma factor (sigma-70 family)